MKERKRRGPARSDEEGDVEEDKEIYGMTQGRNVGEESWCRRQEGKKRGKEGENGVDLQIESGN